MEQPKTDTRASQENEVDVGGIQLFSSDGLFFSSFEEERVYHKNQVEEVSLDENVGNKHVEHNEHRTQI